MRVFIAGLMQGSLRGSGIAPQDYRRRISELIQTHLAEAEIWDPLEMHPDSVRYDREKASRTLVELAERAGEADCLVAYVPEASMGTAVEMWEAYRAGVPVYTISALTENWVVFTLSTRVFADLDAFAGFVATGGLTAK
jgi:hypothetical protein